MNYPQPFSLFVSCPKGLQYALEKELLGFGVENSKPIPSGVYCDADAMVTYRLLLWSRIANRVTLILSQAKVASVDDIYREAENICWSEHFSEHSSFAVNFYGTNEFVTNSNFGAMKLKDAVVDHFRRLSGERPNIDKLAPSYQVVGRLSKGRLFVGIDLSGESLHRRGYRSETGVAPLKENLAAGILRLAGWPDKFDAKSALIDPMCGSGTLLIEAACMSLQRAPGLTRERWGFSDWHYHDAEMWENLVTEARDIFEKSKNQTVGRVIGFDEDARVVRKAIHNIERAGLSDFIHVEKRALEDFTVFEKLEPGLVLSNPPYGERIGNIQALVPLYRLFGEQFERQLTTWQAGIFTGNAELGKKVGWRSFKQYKLYNGAIESSLILFDLDPRNRFKSESLSAEALLQHPASWRVTNEARAQMFRNRLTKNIKKLAKWTKRQGVTCYRIYDADMPEFSLALDRYQAVDGDIWLHVQEYSAPKSIDEGAAIERLSEALSVLPELFGIDSERIVLKRRSVQKGNSQYEKVASDNHFIEVSEYGAKLRVNLKDYLDTGLFLDHRKARQWVRSNVRDMRFLNLFCYTGSVTLNAAIGGAKSSLSIDMSKTYLAWARENLQLNNQESGRHHFLHADCLEWLKSEQGRRQFDVIFMDPPSFSNSKRMDGVLDVQRDHEDMIRQAMSKLATGGTLLFSNNFRKFKLSAVLSKEFDVQDWSSESIDKDFERNSHIHRCWIIKAKH